MSKIGLASLARGYAQGATLVQLERQTTKIVDMSPGMFLDGLREQACAGLVEVRAGVYAIPGAPDRTPITVIFDRIRDRLNAVLPPLLMEQALLEMTVKRTREHAWSIEPPYFDQTADAHCDQNGNWLFTPELQLGYDDIYMCAKQFRRRYTTTFCSSRLIEIWDKLMQIGIRPTLSQLWAFGFVNRYRGGRNSMPTPFFNEWRSLIRL